MPGKKLKETLVKYGLNELAEAFSHEYLIDLNGTQAYRRVRPGVTDASARSEAARLLANPNVQDRIAQLNEERLRRIDISADRVLQELAVIGFSDLADYCEWDKSGVRLTNSSDLPAGKTAAVESVQDRRTKQGVTMSIKLHSKIAALEQLGRHLRLFNDKHMVEGKVFYNIEEVKKEPPAASGA